MKTYFEWLDILLRVIMLTMLLWSMWEYYSDDFVKATYYLVFSVGVNVIIIHDKLRAIEKKLKIDLEN